VPPSPRLGKNLNALKRIDSELVGRISLPVSSDHVVKRDGKTFLRVHRTLHPLQLSAEQANDALTGVEADDDLLLFGIGTGDLVDLCLSATKGRVIVWDRDPWLVRQLLERKDYRAVLESGRLVLKMGASLVSEADSLRSLTRVVHPLLGQIYRNELRILDEPLRAKRALVCAGTLFVDDLSDALHAEGYSVYTWDLSRLAKEELVWAALQIGPSLIAAINYSYGLAETCAALGCPLVIWEIDPSTDLLQPLARRADSMRVFTWRRDHVELFEKGGYGAAEHLPLATNPERRKPVVLDEADRLHFGAPVAFVGASMVGQAQKYKTLFLEAYADFKGGGKGARAGGEALLEAILAAQRNDFSRYLVPALAPRAFPDFVAELGRRPQTSDPFMLLGEIAAAEKRLSYVAALAGHGVQVWGDEGWRALERFGVRYRGPAGHNADLTAIYNAATIHIDIGRIYQSDIVTMRVFDVLACGGFVLAEYSDDLADCFEIGREVECYRTQDELVEKVAYFLAQPKEARAIAARGQTRVLRDHTITARVQHMLSTLPEASTPEA
jgi:spore maturation protein CgeB